MVDRCIGWEFLPTRAQVCHDEQPPYRSDADHSAVNMTGGVTINTDALFTEFAYANIAVSIASTLCRTTHPGVPG